MKKSRLAQIGIGITALVVGASLSACSGQQDNTPPAQKAAEQTANQRNNYIPKNDVEGHNYNARQALADNPSQIIWCSVYPTNPNVKAFTIPIVGKLTSGNKRPYSTSQVQNYYQSSNTYSPELPGSDGFYGTSGEYRYGFDPSGNYHDFYNLETYCTSVPDVIQRQTTQIAITSTGDIGLLSTQAEAAIKACRAKDPDPSKPCVEAARILGE